MEKKKRQKLTQENIFDKKHYQSIIRLLIEYQNKEFQGKKGLKTIHFRYALERNYKDSDDSRILSTIRTLKPWFGERLTDLYKVKAITPDIVTSKQNLTKFLKHLERPPIEIIYKTGQKPDIRYQLKKEFYNEGIRIENKSNIDRFPKSHICYFPHKKRTINEIEYRAGGHVFYGISSEMYNKSFNNEDREFVQKGLKNIDDFFDELRKLKIKRRDEELKSRFQKLVDSTESHEIKRFMKKDGMQYSSYIQTYLNISRSSNPDDRDEIDITKSKKVFFYKFGYPFLIPPGEHVPRLWIRTELVDAFKKYLFKKRKKEKRKTEKENMRILNKYAEVWGDIITIGYKDTYKFNFKEIGELIQWAWDNRDFFLRWSHIETEYSRYGPWLINELSFMLDLFEND